MSPGAARLRSPHHPAKGRPDEALPSPLPPRRRAAPPARGRGPARRRDPLLRDLALGRADLARPRRLRPERDSVRGAADELHRRLAGLPGDALRALRLPRPEPGVLREGQRPRQHQARQGLGVVGPGRLPRRGLRVRPSARRDALSRFRALGTFPGVRRRRPRPRGDAFRRATGELDRGSPGLHGDPLQRNRLPGTLDDLPRGQPESPGHAGRKRHGLLTPRRLRRASPADPGPPPDGDAPPARPRRAAARGRRARRRDPLRRQELPRRLRDLHGRRPRPLEDAGRRPVRELPAGPARLPGDPLQRAGLRGPLHRLRGGQRRPPEHPGRQRRRPVDPRGVRPAAVLPGLRGGGAPSGAPRQLFRARRAAGFFFSGAAAARAAASGTFATKAYASRSAAGASKSHPSFSQE